MNIERIDQLGKTKFPDQQESNKSRSWIKTALIVGLVLSIILIPAIAYGVHAAYSAPMSPQQPPPLRPICCSGPAGNGTCVPLNALQAKVNRLAWQEKLVVEPPIPTRSAVIQEKESRNWVNAHCSGKARSAAQKLLDVTKRVSHQEFEEELGKSVGQFNKWLACQKSKDYVLLVTSREARKSNRWVAELALKHLDVLPVNVIKMSYELTPEILEFAKQHPHVKHYVFLDDASYSGTQAKKFACELSNIDLQNECDRYSWRCKRERVDQILKTEKTRNVIAIIPFMRDPEAIKMKSAVTTSCMAVSKVSSHIQVFSSKKMKTLGELMDREQLEELETNSQMEEKVPTYFDHKMPDFLSVPSEIYANGKVRQRGDCGGNSIKFIPPIAPPYK